MIVWEVLRGVACLHWQPPAPLLTHGPGYICIFPQIAMTPIWVPVRDVCLAMDQPASTKEGISQDGQCLYSLCFSQCPPKQIGLLLKEEIGTLNILMRHNCDPHFSAFFMTPLEMRNVSSACQKLAKYVTGSQSIKFLYYSL